MLKNSNFYLALLFLILLVGCSAAPKQLAISNTIPDGENSGLIKKAFSNNVRLSAEGAKMNNLELALRESLQRHGLYAKQRNEWRFLLTPRIIQEVPPKPGLGMTGLIIVEYILEDFSPAFAGSREIVFQSKITSEFSAGVADKVLGVERSLFVVEGYIRKSIESFFKVLDENSSRVISRDVELRKQADYEKTMRFLTDAFLKFDVFTSTSFKAAFPVDRYQNYSLRDVISRSWSSLISKIRAASLEDIKLFHKNYGIDLTDNFRREVEQLIRDKTIDRGRDRDRSTGNQGKTPRSRSGGLPPLTPARP